MAHHERAGAVETAHTRADLPGGFTLVRGKAGYDVTGTLKSVRTPRGSDLDNRLRFCVGKCSQERRCTGFTLYGRSCYLKDSKSTGRRAQFRGERRAGWRWYYLKQGAPPSPRCAAG